jgi:hypothetical protein
MANQKAFSRRLAMLKTEVGLDFEGLIQSLEAGLQTVVVTEPGLCGDLEPDVLRRVGGMVALCNHYGAAVVFVSGDKFAEFCGKASVNS